MYKPSALEEWMAKLPPQLQGRAMRAVLEEKARLDRGDYTPEEEAFRAQVRKLAIAARQHRERIALKVVMGQQ